MEADDSPQRSPFIPKKQSMLRFHVFFVSTDARDFQGYPCMNWTKTPDEAMATFGYKFSRKLETKRSFDDIRFGSEVHL